MPETMGSHIEDEPGQVEELKKELEKRRTIEESEEETLMVNNAKQKTETMERREDNELQEMKARLQELETQIALMKEWIERRER